VSRVGINQLRTLIMTASPGRVLLTPSAGDRALVQRGLLREREPGGACCITPAGLRALADAMEAGRVDDALEAMLKEVAARAAKATSLPAPTTQKAPTP
jgi:hypothetical protein